MEALQDRAPSDRHNDSGDPSNDTAYSSEPEILGPAASDQHGNGSRIH